jgi:cardiolipin hydrolase
MSKKLFVACAVLGSLAAEAMLYLYSWYKKKKEEKKKLGDTVLQILFFPDQRIRCNAHFNERRGCRKLNCPYSHETNSLSELTRYLNGARMSIDLCVFTITCHELGDHIVELHRSGLKVRVITDIEQIDATGSQIGKFRREGTVGLDTVGFILYKAIVIVNIDE